MAIILFLLVIVADQITKAIIASNETSVVIIDKLLSFIYTKNSGAAFSFLNNKDWAQTMFIIITFIALIAFAYMYYKTNKKAVLLKYSLILIMSGAIGNLIDRIRFNYVVDFISIHFFPAIFNVADAALTIGATLFVLHYLFFDKDAIFKRKSKSENE
jgi:signal peptidase II